MNNGHKTTAERLAQLADLYAEQLDGLGRNFHTDNLRLKTAMECARKLAPILPDGWRTTYSGGTLYIEKTGDKDHPNSPIDFRFVCEQCARITGDKGQRHFSGTETTSGQLTGYFYGQPPHDCPPEDNWGRRINIRVQLGAPTCKVKFKKVRRKAQRAYFDTVAQVPPECLGLEPEE